jgi:cation diffusion facilitator CzcD-associated flavoprotein CzcO
MDAFRGQVVHPQTWPDDLDCTGKRVVVIGSGATAATLVPGLAGRCAELTMLQRSPGYFTVGRNAVALADELRQLKVDEHWIHEIVRRKLMREREAFTKRAREEPEAVKQELLQGVRAHLGPDFDVDRHFTPRYRPWQQRVAFDPDGAFFRAFREGQAQIVTDEIECFTEGGIQLRSGRLLEADVVVTATGFDLSVLGDIRFAIDGKPLVFSDTVAYRGMMFTGVPNLAWIFGYFRASWTLRADLVAGFVCRLLRHMDRIGAQCVTPALRPEDRGMALRPWMPVDDFHPGYLARGLHLLPRQGNKPEWQINQDYLTEREEFAAIDLDSPVFDYARAEQVA